METRAKNGLAYLKNRIYICDRQRKVRPLTLNNNYNIVAVKRMVVNNKRIKVDEVIIELNITFGLIFSIIIMSL